MKEFDLSKEIWREYDFGGRVYRITHPITLYLRPDGTTHRVLDLEGIVHCVPSVGHMGCVLRWKNLDEKNPINF